MKIIRLALVFLLLAAAVYGQTNKLSPDLQGLPDSTRIDVIVQSSGSVSSSLLQSLVGSVLKVVVNLTNGLTYTVLNIQVSALNSLVSEPNVLYISPDRQLLSSGISAARATGASAEWLKGYSGSGIGVAVIDSGVISHADLTQPGLLGLPASRVVYHQNFVRDGLISSLLQSKDPYGHGTHVAGIIAGSGVSSSGAGYHSTFTGIAPSARIIDLRVLDENGQGRDSYVLSAIAKAIELKKQYNIRVINLSLGRPVIENYRKDPLGQAVEAAWQAGIVVVTAAGNLGRLNLSGNQGYGTVLSPANHPQVITVGAVKFGDENALTGAVIGSYSSKGPTRFDHIVKPDLVAAGTHITSLAVADGTLYAKYPDNRIPYSSYCSRCFGTYSREYFDLNGTSMAAPMVSGAAVLLLSKNSGLQPDQVKAILMKTAVKAFPLYSVTVDSAAGTTYVSQHDAFTIGAGMLNIPGAMALAGTPIGKAQSPSAYFDTAAQRVKLRIVPGSIWGSSPAWDAASIWGTVNYDASTASLWGGTAVWAATSGTTFVWGTDGLFGGTFVWGTGGTDGTTFVWGTDGQAQ